MELTEKTLQPHAQALPTAGKNKIIMSAEIMHLISLFVRMKYLTNGNR